MDLTFHVIETVKHKKANEFIDECKKWQSIEVIIRLMLIGVIVISYGMYLLSCNITEPFYLHAILKSSLVIFCMSLLCILLWILAELGVFVRKKTHFLNGFFCKTEKDWLKHSLYFPNFSEGLRVTKQLELENKEIIEMKILDWKGENRWNKAEFICRDKEIGKTKQSILDYDGVFIEWNPDLKDDEVILDLSGLYPVAYIRSGIHA